MLSREALDAEKSGGAVKGRVLRTPLGHESQKCIALSRFWHGRGIAKSIIVEVFLFVAQSVLEFTVLQLKGECFAPPSAMICAVAMSRADSGMGVGSSSLVYI